MEAALQVHKLWMQGSLSSPKIMFFLKPIIQELFFYKNANVVFIGKSEFFLNSFRLLQKPLVFGRGVGKHREPKSQN